MKVVSLLSLLALCLMPMASAAHPLGEVVQETTVQNEGTRLLIIYRTSIGPSITATLIPDADRDGKVSSSEEGALSRTINKILYPNLVVTLDDKPVVLELYYDSVAPALGGYSNGVRANLIYSLPIGDQESVTHTIKVSDNNFKAGELKWIKWFVQAEPQLSKVSTTVDSRTLELSFVSAVDGGALTKSGTLTDNRFESGTGLAPKPQEDSSQAALREYLSRENLGTGAALFALGLAFVLGMGHALSPGHGKAMVAAYLIGRSGKVKDAFTLGIIVTITHVASVIVLGIAALLLSRYFLPGDLYPWLGAFSGILVFFVGYIMLAKRALHNGHHHHHHDDSEKESEPVSWWSMLSLGIAGGMVPCPTALVVLLAAVALGRIVFGLLLIFSFSLGLAAVLIIIGVLTVRASKLTERFSGSRKLIKNLPVASAGLVMLAGIAIALNALQAGGILRFFP
ncbi:nickel/cobalt transporter [Maridesulfovibrio frigidus]|uniref:nickel/cobalt transporter n=1 Tax=Maridesulfovibrio frigidus TaxID=340956 RepID=UPI0004E1614E|nr:sulfite exporter TauE/SafE family protein [Maridesulfovibrio frigidus]